MIVHAGGRQIDHHHARTDAAAELARRSIETEKRAALSELRREVADLAVQAAGVILDAELDDDRNRKLVDDLIARIPDTPASN